MACMTSGASSVTLQSLYWRSSDNFSVPAESSRVNWCSPARRLEDEILESRSFEKGRYRRPSAAVLGAKDADAEHRLWRSCAPGGDRLLRRGFDPHPPRPAQGRARRPPLFKGRSSKRHRLVPNDRRSYSHATPACLRVILIALAVVWPVLARAQDNAPASGAWQLEPVPEGQAKPESISLRATAIGHDDASLSLRCRPDVPLYEFVIRDPRLAKLPAAAEVSLAIRHSSREPVRLLASARGDGRVLIQERVHQMTFSSLLGALGQHHAAPIELAIDDDRWAFPLQGFAPAFELLTAQCGFEPGPARGRRKGRAPDESDPRSQRRK